MKILILNGSPKGDTSVTMQYVKYLELSFKEPEFIRINAAQKVQAYKKNSQKAEELFGLIESCDIVLMAFPLYYLLCASSFKEFIEWLYENDAYRRFRGKYAAVLTTSIHYFDNTAVNYAEGVCEDWGMSLCGSFTPKMDDILDKEKRKALDFFFHQTLLKAEKKIPVPRHYPESGLSSQNLYQSLPFTPLSSQAKVTIVSDNQSENTQAMKKMALNTFPQAYLFELDTIKMGPCLGCLKCGFDNVCAYEGKDEFIEKHKKTIMQADMIIYCLTMKDRYFSYLWQRSLERSFYRTHQPILKGKQIAFLISGKLEENFCARNTLESYIGTFGTTLAGMLNDSLNADDMGTAFQQLALQLTDSVEQKIIMPSDFRGVAGMKIFRDDIMDGLRAVFQKDHKYYKKHGIYDFPHKNPLKMIAMSVFTLISRLPPLRKKIRANFKTFMLQPYQPILKKLSQESEK